MTKKVNCVKLGNLDEFAQKLNNQILIAEILYNYDKYFHSGNMKNYFEKFSINFKKTKVLRL